MNYTFGRNAQGKSSQKTLVIGGYPVVTLLEARAARDEAKALLRDGRDPSAVKQEKASAKDERATQTFESVAILWFELKSGWSVELFRSWRAAHDGKWSKKDASHWINRPNAGWSIVHSGDVLRSLERDVFPDLGGTSHR